MILISSELLGAIKRQLRNSHGAEINTDMDET